MENNNSFSYLPAVEGFQIIYIQFLSSVLQCANVDHCETNHRTK